MSHHINRLREISTNTHPTEEQIIDFFQIVEQNYPNGSWVGNREVRNFVESVERNISAQPWAREWSNAIRSSRENRRSLIISTGRDPLPNVRNIDAFNPSDLQRTARQILDGNIETRNNRNVFLFQSYINTVTSLSITVDGVAGRETLEAIGNNLKETQVFLREIGARNADGTPLTVDEVIGDDTQRALNEYLGLRNMDVASLRVIENVTEAVELLQNLSDNELLVQLQEANNNLPQRARDKRSYISEFARRFGERHIMIRVDENNVHRVIDHTGLVSNVGLSNVDLQAIMILLSIRENNIEDDRASLSENIANNIFDSVVEQYNFRNGSRHWRAQDFIASGEIITEAEVESNKQSALSQIQIKITELEITLSQTQTDIDRGNIRSQIQRLEISRMFVRNQNGSFSGESLAVAQSISQDAQNLIRSLGGGEAARSAVNGGSAGEIRNALMANVPSFIVGGIFAILARILPSPFKEIAYGIIGSIVGLGVFEDLQNRGIIPSVNGSASGINRPSVVSPDGNNLTDALREILTRAPTGLEERHKTRYTEVVTRNNETSAVNERQKLDHMYLFLSQDHIFGSQDITTIDTSDRGSFDWSTMSSYSQERLQALGVTSADIILFLRLLKDTNSDSADQHMRDIFVVGQVNDVANILDVTWVQGTLFETENRDVNLFLSRLTGVSVGASETIRGNSPRSQVEEILSSAQPDVLAWLGQNLAERTSLIREQVPSSEMIQNILEALNALNFNGTDNDNLRGIIGAYEGINEKLRLDEDSASFIAEASSIYTISGRAYTSMQDVVYWIQNLGEPIPTNNRVPITTESIQALIEAGETLRNRDGITDGQKIQVEEAIRNLRLYLVRTLDMGARNADLNDNDRAGLRNLSDEVLGQAVATHPEIYTNTLEAMQVSLAPLSRAQTSTQAYLNLLSTHRRELVALQRLQRITTGVAEFDSNSTRVYNEVFSEGILRNMTSYIGAQNEALTNFDTTGITDFETLQARNSSFQQLSEQFTGQNLVADMIRYFSIADDYAFEFQGQTVMDLPVLAEGILRGIDGETHSLGFDRNTLLSKQRQLEEASVNLEAAYDTGLSLGDDIDFTAPETITGLIAQINGHYDTINQMQNTDIKNDKLVALSREVSRVIDRMTAQLIAQEDSIEAITPLTNAYASLITSNVGNAENESFESALRSKEEEIYINAIQSMTLETILNNSTGTTFTQQLERFMTNGNVRIILAANPIINSTPNNIRAQDILNPQNYTSTTLVQLFDLFDYLSQQNLGTEEETGQFRNFLGGIRNNISRDASGSLDRQVRSWIIERYTTVENFLQGLTH